MANDTTMRLRDQRKPGHGWFDNEIYDVFGDELQQNGISVYMTLARLCYGVRVTMSLREMAGHARMSKDTFGRTLKRVISLGLVVERKGATPQSASTYELVDVKELAGAYLREAVQKNKQKASLNVPSVSQRDTAPMPTLVELLSNRAVASSVEPAANDDAGCLTVRQEGDADAGVDKKICDAPDATGVSQKVGSFETEVSHDVRHLRQDTRHKTQNQYSPQPPLHGGGAVSEVSFERDSREIFTPGANGCGVITSQGLPNEREGVGCSAADAAVAKVMRECSLSNPRLDRVIYRAMEAEHALSDAAVVWNATAERMIHAWREFGSVAQLMRHSVGARKFFSEGMWCNWKLWPYDRQAVSEARRL